MTLIDFGAPGPTWSSIDDSVMGGVSSSGMMIENRVGVFSGTVSLANNGGFASVRTLPASYGLAAHDSLVVQVRGDGRRYKIRLRTTDSFDGVSYQASIDPPAGRWTEIEVPFTDFVPVWRGRRVADYEALDAARIRTFGLLISDNQAGPFRLEIAWIGATPAEVPGDFDVP